MLIKREELNLGELFMINMVAYALEQIIMQVI